jgi:TRAP-type mannitol/chloroaromatic compound transport system permease small subunit
VLKLIKTAIRVSDGISEFIGKTAAWCSILMVVVTFYIVITRYVFNIGSIAVQESVIYLNALLFLLTCAYTLKHDGHVRVDIFYGPAGPRYKAWVNLLGGLFLLLPVITFILLVSWDYVAAAWRIRETSPEAGGIPYVYLLKSLIVVMTFLVLLQGLTEILRNVLFLFFDKEVSEGAPTGHSESAGGIL